jgi:3-isopropylmalate/(R)-2-methylmalate dehydratase small subunit
MIRGKVLIKLGDDVSTDVIYPGRFMATVLPTETPAHAFADFAEFNRMLRAKEFAPGSIIVAGSNFGCGSSREQAASCLRGHELTVIAKGFARIFLQNAINVGLKVVVCPTLEAEEGDDLELAGEAVFNHASERFFPVTPMPRARQAIVDAGGLIPYTRTRMEEETAKSR